MMYEAGLAVGCHDATMAVTAALLANAAVAPGFQGAGVHWTPAGRQHGHLNPLGAHAGKLPDLTVSRNGRRAPNFLFSGHALGDADGTSLVIHARPDDYKTDPSGNSGDRIACAVLTTSATGG